MGVARTRVAVVQLAYHPAILVDRRSPLEDPLFTAGVPDALSASGKELPEAFASRLEALRRRIRETYAAQILGRVQAILAACRVWKVEVVVFPEYSIPWEILGGVADAAKEMVVVAGTHTVEPAAKRAGVYERLALARELLPALGQSVAPVLHRGRLIGLSAKLNPSQHERQMKPGGAWAPIEMPGGIPGPMGILVCLDFLYRESTAHRTLVSEAMERCRFLAVPSLTPAYTLSEFTGKAWEEARRYGRPVLYCDGAEGGGTAIYVDEGRPADLRSFPEHAGLLDAGDEGVIVADVDLGYERPGRSTRYAGSQPVVAVAAATLVYRANPTADAYARWLEEVGPVISRDDDEAVETLSVRVQAGRDVLLNAGALSGGAARGRRLLRLVHEIEKVTSVEEVRLLTREVVVPAEVLPLPVLRAAMAKGAADAVFAWMKERRGGGLEDVERRLREAGEATKAGDAGAWTHGGTAAIEAAVLAVRGVVEEEAKPVPVELPVRVVLPKGVDPAALGLQTAGGFSFDFRANPRDFQTDSIGEFEVGHSSVRSNQFSEAEVWAAEGWILLAVAEGAKHIAAVSISQTSPANQSAREALAVLSSHDDGWVLWTGNIASWVHNRSESIVPALGSIGLLINKEEHLTTHAHADRVGLLQPRLDGASKVIEALREQRLKEVRGRFEEPLARVNGGDLRPVLAVLDDWILSSDQTALVLGEFGSGKSTALAVWGERRWKREQRPLPILVHLAGATPGRDAEGLLLDAAGAADTPANRAALRLLVRYRYVLPCFDGFDEIATRLGAQDLAERISALLEIARGGPGQVLVSCRDNYFPTGAQLNTTSESALLQALGSTAGVRRITLELFDARQVEELITKVSETPEDAKEALGRIEQTYDLKDLVRRPLLLGMVLATLDRLEPAATVGTADLYEAYLRRWLNQTHSGDPECFSDEQKTEFAEALADQLWRNGQASCTWQELQASVRARLAQHLPDDTPPAAAFLEIQGGAFFVREGEDRYRFAHKSFLEYFLARGLVRTLPERPAEVLETRPITQEVAAFVGEVLRREGNPKQSKAVQAVQTWLVSGRMGAPAPLTPPAIGCSSEPMILSAMNALRLLLGLVRWSKALEGWIPQGADLRGVNFRGGDLRGARLLNAKLNCAQLSGADLRDADLSGATLDGAQLRGVRLDKAALRKVTARGADLAQAEADQADLKGADFSGAILRQSMWTACQWEEVTTEGADLTAWAAPGSRKTPAGRSPVRIDATHMRVGFTHGPQGVVLAAAWSSDRASVAIGGDDGIVSLWSVISGTLLAQFNYSGAAICAMAWSPDNTRIATSSLDGLLRIWHIKTGAELARHPGHEGPARAIVWSPDGRNLASAGDDGVVRISDTADEAQITWDSGHHGAIHALAWSPDGRRLASAGDEGIVRMWDATRGVPLAYLRGHQGSVYTLAWSPDGTRLASAGKDALVRTWIEGETSAHACLTGHEGIVRSLAWTADSRRLASTSFDGTIRIWDVVHSCELPYRAFDSWSRLIHNWRPFISVVWNADGAQLFSVNTGGYIFAWNAQTGEREMNPLGWSSEGVRAVAWSPKGTHLACMRSYAGEVSLWDVKHRRVDAHLRQQFAADATTITWRPDGTGILIGNSIGGLCLVDVVSGETLSTFIHRSFADGVTTVAWHPKGVRFASNAADGMIEIWDVGSAPDPVNGSTTTIRADGTQQIVNNPPLRRPIAWLHTDTTHVRALAWHPSGDRIVSSGDDGDVQFWDGTTFQSGDTLRIGLGTVNALAWSPDGARLVGCGSEGTLWIWEADTNVLTEFGASASTMAWHPGGRLLASAEADGVLRLWDVANAKNIKTIPAGGRAIMSLAWHPDGHWLAGSDADGIIRIWDTDKGWLLVLGELAGHNAIIRTPGGFCEFIAGNPSSYRLALHPADQISRMELYLPLAGLYDVFYNPDKVKAALAGDLSGDDLNAELERIGFADGASWDAHVLQGEGRREPADVLEGPLDALRGSPEIASSGLMHERVAYTLGEQLAEDEHKSHTKLFRPGPALADTAALPPGREPIIARLLDHLRRGMPTVLRGHRRSGKTSILRHLAHRLASSARYATLEGRRIKTAADLACVLDPTLKDDDAANLLRDRLHAEPAAVLLLDEVGHLRDAEPNLFAWIRAVGQDGTGVLLSGSPWDWTQVVHHAASAPGSSFSNDITPVDLGPLSEADAIRFLIDTAPVDVPIKADKTARWIVDRCGAWPFYLQVMGDAVVRAVLAGNRRALVEAAGVSDLYEQSLFAAHDGSFQVRWEELPAAAQAIVRAIRGRTKPVYKDLGRDEQKVLRDTGLCDARGQWIDDRPFFEWIQRTITRSTKPPPVGSAPESTESDMIPKLPKPLIDAYKKGKLALFIGSGLSRGADVKGDFPGWKDLPERLLGACAKYSVRDDKWIENKRDLFQGRMRLEEMLAELGALRAALDRDYQAALHDIFSPRDASPGAAHRAVAALATPAVLTTNYDQLLEAADPLPGRQPYTWRHADRALNALRGERKVLLKVHGSVEDHESVVMSDREYAAARSDPSYQAVLRYLLQDNMFLFVGYGMNDPLDLDLAFKANADAFRTSTQKHFVLLRNPSETDADRYHREYCVEVIAYSEHDDVTAFLDGLARS